MTDRILVTGLSGFIASHVTALLLDQGFAVRGTVRNLIKGQRIVDALSKAGTDVSRLELVEADLDSDTGWKSAVADCRFVQHIASPFPLDAPVNREALVPAARAGAMRVVEQALGAGVERVVMTSSMVAMIGQPGRGATMAVTEADWSDPEWKPMTAYPVSKTRAERAVWDYAKASGLSGRITTICPGLVFGPDTYKNGGASLKLLRGLLDGDMPMAPKVAYPIVDVRDLASTHVKAMTADVGGRRLISASDTLSMVEIAEVIRALVEADMPMMGICLGHQLLALALGAQTVKMEQGHHGANHPVRDDRTGKVEIVSMNHGFAVDAATLPETVEATHVSLFDGTNCGIRVKGKPIFSVQHHPEASPGPQDSFYIFEEFADAL